MPIETPRLSRRNFLRAGALASLGLVVGFSLTSEACAAPATEDLHKDAVAPNAFLRIAPDGAVTVLIPKSEMGQGVLTSLAMIVAEELDVDWARVSAIEAPAGAAYRFSPLGQLTAGSDSVRGTWDPLRQAGATARAMLVSAAAERWGVSADTCRTERGVVLDATGARKLGYGELADTAMRRGQPWKVTLKDPADYRIVGQRLARLDTPSKVNGTAIYGIDVKLPGMLIACIARCPVFGGTLKHFDASKTLAVKGVRQAVAISNGVAVVADHYWAARKGVEALDVTWDEGPAATYSTETQRKDFEQLARGRGREAFVQGDVHQALKDAGATRVEALYELPFLAHMTMEPQNCTAVVADGRCEIWAPTQAQTAVQRAASAVTGISADDIIVHTTYLGGGFGRRSEADYAGEAAEVAKAVGKPIKVIWSRPDDIHHDFYRPANTHHVEAALSSDGRLVAWKHHVVAQSVLERWLPAPLFWVMHDPITASALDAEFAYAVPHRTLEVTDAHTPIPVGFWRSVGYGHNVYVAEHFMDELARQCKQDPLQFRLRNFTDRPRLKAVLELAAQQARWGTLLPKGHYHGIATCSAFGSHVAQVAEISIEDNDVTVHKVVCAVDCGQVINPAIIEAQMHSGIMFGLSKVLFGDIKIENGRVQQNNFDSYPVVRMREAPEVEVHIVINHERPGGIGEVGVPCLAPAVANAVLAATGKAHRRMPLILGQA